jgi:hypothetical protein
MSNYEANFELLLPIIYKGWLRLRDSELNSLIVKIHLLFKIHLILRK